MTYLHLVDPVALDLSKLASFLPKIHWYGLMYLASFMVFWMLANYRAKQARFDWTREQVSDYLFFGVIGVVLGGRLGYLLFYDFANVLDDPHRIYQIWKGGMSYHGGLIGVTLALWYFTRKTGKSFWQSADFIVPCAAIGLFFGRLGNLIGGELWGRLTQSPLGILFPKAPELEQFQYESIASLAPEIANRSLDWVQLNRPDIFEQSIAMMQTAADSGALAAFARHPSQLYQALLEGLLLWLVVWLFSGRQRPVMSVTGLYFAGYGVCRFIVEFFRQPDSHIGTLAFDWLTMGQLLSIPLIMLGVGMIIVAYRKQASQTA